MKPERPLSALSLQLPKHSLFLFFFGAGDIGSLSEMVSEGKSGSFFYFSQDARFMVKTISSTEHRTLLKILEAYHSHMLRNRVRGQLSLCFSCAVSLFCVDYSFVSTASLFLMTWGAELSPSPFPGSLSAQARRHQPALLRGHAE